MPRAIEFPRYSYSTKPIDGHDGSGIFPVATEEELIEFVNRGRAAGGAAVIDALFPSYTGLADQCLIANALNFSCEVRPNGLVCDEEGRRSRWLMELPTNVDNDRAKTIADALGIPVASKREERIDPYNPEEPPYIIPARLGPLPAHIGNAADAFDNRLAFEEYNQY